MSDFAVIAERARRLASVNLRPKNAATLILVDRSGSVPKVLMGKRHSSHVFMPDRFVFPGGRIEVADHYMPIAAPLDGSVEARLMHGVARSSVRTGRAFALAAIRETFEEAGIIVDRRHGGAHHAPAPWADFLATGFLPDPSGLRFIARAITPPRSKRRFDARFFAADASVIVHQRGNVVHSRAELTEIVWVSIAEAMRLPLPDITEIVLGDLHDRLADGFAFDVAAPFYRMQDGRFTRELI
jgi:8-oxo-dGTP pyrophosphatase MutT (NUDIX family)